MMGGACIRGDSLILLPNGNMITIKELVDKREEKEIVAVDPVTLKLTTAEITDYVDSGIQQTLKITLDSGRIIQGTLDHPVIIKPRKTRQPKWEQLQNLKVGDTVAVPREIAYFGNIHEKNARLLGMLIGDGSYSKGSVWYASEDKELWNYIETNYSDNNIDIRETFITKKNQIYKSGRISGINQLLRDVGIFGQAYENKTLPVNWINYDKESLSNLIAGLIDTDGNVHIEKNKNIKHQKVTIKICQISKSIIYDLQIALLKFGIHSKIGTGINKDGQGYGKTHRRFYTLTIKNKESIENFHKNIKLLVSRKQRTLNNGVILLKSHKYKIQKDLYDTDLRFEKIVSIEDTGLEQVYDLTVKDIHNFIANGIIVHNTNAKMIKIGTPKTRNHFYESMEGQGAKEWCTIRRDWTQCPQLWALAATNLPDHNDPNHSRIRPYSTYVLSLMPKALKQEYFPNNPEVWTEGQMSVEDFKTQYMLQFIDGVNWLPLRSNSYRITYLIAGNSY